MEKALFPAPIVGALSDSLGKYIVPTLFDNSALHATSNAVCARVSNPAMDNCESVGNFHSSGKSFKDSCIENHEQSSIEGFGCRDHQPPMPSSVPAAHASARIDRFRGGLHCTMGLISGVPWIWYNHNLATRWASSQFLTSVLRGLEIRTKTPFSGIGRNAAASSLFFGGFRCPNCSRVEPAGISGYLTG